MFKPIDQALLNKAKSQIESQATDIAIANALKALQELNNVLALQYSDAIEQNVKETIFNQLATSLVVKANLS